MGEWQESRDPGIMRQATTYRLIWDIVRQIPKGKVSTYGEIARLAGVIGHARLVGYALRNLPTGMDVPWHRVISSQGKISLPRANGDCEKQERLLKREGVLFENNRVDLEKFGWLHSIERDET